MIEKYMTISEIEAIPFDFKTVIIHNFNCSATFRYFDNLGKENRPRVVLKDNFRNDERVKRTEILHEGKYFDDTKKTTKIYYDIDGNILYENYNVLGKNGFFIDFGKIEIIENR